MRFSLLACLSLLALLAPLLAAEIPKPSQWNLLRLAHPDARLLLGLDWGRALASPVGPILRKQVQLGGHPLLEFLESIDNVGRMFVSSPGAAGTQGRAPLLVVGEGRFSLAKVRAMAQADGAVSRRYSGVELLVPPDATNLDLHFALVNPQLILFGDGVSVKAAIDRFQKGEQPEPAGVHARAAALSAANELWVAARDPASAFTALGIQSGEVADDVVRLELGVSLTQSLAASLFLETGSEESAQVLATGLPALLQLAALQFSGQPALAQVARRLKTVREKNLLRMGFTLDGRLLEQSLAELRSAAAPAPPPVSSSAPTHSAQPPSDAVTAAAHGAVPAQAAPSPRKIIRILGAEDGLREIPYPAQPTGAPR